VFVARFGLKPEHLAADTAFGSAANLDWLVNEKQIAPHIPVIDKSKRDDVTFSREHFTFDKARDAYICPVGNMLTMTGKVVNDDLLLCRGQQTRLRRLPIQDAMLPEGAGA
jgi:hypothetical protein